jgi:hypothetical protein
LEANFSLPVKRRRAQRDRHGVGIGRFHPRANSAPHRPVEWDAGSNRQKQTVAVGWLIGPVLRLGLDGQVGVHPLPLSKPSTDPLFLDRTDDIARHTHGMSIGMRKKGFNIYLHAHYSPHSLFTTAAPAPCLRIDLQGNNTAIFRVHHPDPVCPSLVPGRRNAIGTTQALSLAVQQKTLTYIIYAPSQKILPAYLQPTARYAQLAVTIHPPVC